MAAALFEAGARERQARLRVSSAGIAAFTGQSPPRAVIALMAKRGLDVSAHQAQQLTGALARRQDLILVMDGAQQAFIETHWEDLKGKVRRLGAWRDLDIGDPYGLTVKSYVDCLRSIEVCVRDWESHLLTHNPRVPLDLPR